MMDQGYRATCSLVGVDRWHEYIISIAAPRVCELLQLGKEVQRKTPFLEA